MTERDNRHTFIWAMTGLLHVNVMSLQAAEPAAAGKQPKSQKQVDQKLALVERMLFQSPLGEQAAKSPTDLDPAAYKAWLSAGLAFELAVEALERQNRANADESLDSALAYYREASALNRKANRPQQDFSQRLLDLKSRVQGYRDSLDRIAKEKNVSLSDRVSREQINQAMATAELFEQQGEPEKAVQVLQSLQTALESELVLARSGETLVSSVEFDSPEEAFAYEIKKNRSNEQLLGLLSSSNTMSEGKRQLIENYLQESRDASANAMRLRDKGDIEAALQALESATTAQTLALRMFGVNM